MFTYFELDLDIFVVRFSCLLAMKAADCSDSYYDMVLWRQFMIDTTRCVLLPIPVSSMQKWVHRLGFRGILGEVSTTFPPSIETRACALRLCFPHCFCSPWFLACPYGGRWRQPWSICHSISLQCLFRGGLDLASTRSPHMRCLAPLCCEIFEPSHTCRQISMTLRHRCNTKLQGARV